MLSVKWKVQLFYYGQVPCLLSSDDLSSHGEAHRGKSEYQFDHLAGRQKELIGEELNPLTVLTKIGKYLLPDL